MSNPFQCTLSSSSSFFLWFFGPFPGHGLPHLNEGFKGVFYWVRLTLCQTANLQEQDFVLGFTTIGTWSVWLLCWSLFSFGDCRVSHIAAGTAPNNLPAQYRAKLLRKHMPRIPAISVSDAKEVWYVKDRHVGTSSDTRHKEYMGHLHHGQPKSATVEHIRQKAAWNSAAQRAAHVEHTAK